MKWFHRLMLVLCFAAGSGKVPAQVGEQCRLMLHIPLIDLPQNIDLPYHYPSMGQATAISASLYDLSYYGMDRLSLAIFGKGGEEPIGWKKYGRKAFSYLSGLAFARYASELPVPLGVWGHEEFHRAVLGVAGYDSRNGNWLLHRWDGTVYGISDSSLATLKSEDPDQLLYSYVSGSQYELLLNREIVTRDFFTPRTQYSNPLLLYNAWYLYNYLRLSVSPLSDSVKVIAPQFESPLPEERDFAGLDFTAWAYDMFNPDSAYLSRSPFPNGSGVNRRIGFSDLSPDAQQYLKKQRSLSLLNFLNPAIFLVNRIRMNADLEFMGFVQYMPVHFGNDISLVLLGSVSKYHLSVVLHRYGAYDRAGGGLELGLYDYPIGESLQADVRLNSWIQARSFFSDTNVTGGSVTLSVRYRIWEKWQAAMQIRAKTAGWEAGSPYLSGNLSVSAGLGFCLGQ